MIESAQLLQRDFWTSFAPQLHVGEPAAFAGISAVRPTAPQEQEVAMLLRQEGYFQGQLDWKIDVKRMAETVRALSNAGISPVFAFVFDEYWLPFFRLHHVISSLLGGNYRLLPDFWVWNVDPKRGNSGWRPHRDKGRKALWPDGSAKSLTVWIPLSAATPLNGCMYIVPAHSDPTYATADEDTWKFEFPSVRALPAQPGDFFVWNQAVLHWGSKTSPRGAESRVSMAFEFQRVDVPPFNEPLLEPLQFMPFEARLRLVSKQIVQYRHMYALQPEIEKFARLVLA